MRIFFSDFSDEKVFESSIVRFIGTKFDVFFFFFTNNYSNM